MLEALEVIIVCRPAEVIKLVCEPPSSHTISLISLELILLNLCVSLPIQSPKTIVAFDPEIVTAFIVPRHLKTELGA